jgi:FkbM family methyltransferase
MKQIISYLKRDGLSIFSRKILFKTLTALHLNSFFRIDIYNQYILLENTDLTYQLFANKKYKDREYEIYKKYITSEMVCVDVGANIGLMTLMFSQMAPSGVIHSFEPSLKLYTVLSKNIQANKLKNCILYKMALGDTDSVVRFDETVADDTTFKMSVYGNTDVEQKRLDTVFKDVQRIDFMKIDVEGYELEVLLGGTETLRKTKLLFIEFISDNQKNTNHSEKLLIETLEKYFTIYTLDDDLHEVPFVYSGEATYQTDLLCRLT